jgi:hypothetical protein
MATKWSPMGSAGQFFLLGNETESGGGFWVSVPFAFVKTQVFSRISP